MSKKTSNPPPPKRAVKPPAPPGPPNIIKPMAVLRLQKGDVIVLMSERLIPQGEHERIISSIERVFPGHKAIVLEGGIKIGAVRKGRG